MTLPPKTQHEFERYFAKQWHEHWLNPGKLAGGEDIIDWLESLPFAFQQGVYQEYFASVGLPIWVKPFENEWQGNVAHLMRTRFDTYEVVHQLALRAAAELREGQLG